jgi:hypothetical protein
MNKFLQKIAVIWAKKPTFRQIFRRVGLSGEVRQVQFLSILSIFFDIRTFDIHSWLLCWDVAATKAPNSRATWALFTSSLHENTWCITLGRYMHNRLINYFKFFMLKMMDTCKRDFCSTNLFYKSVSREDRQTLLKYLKSL